MKIYYDGIKHPPKEAIKILENQVTSASMIDLISYIQEQNKIIDEFIENYTGGCVYMPELNFIEKINELNEE